MSDNNWSIIIHGGAKNIEPHEEESHRAAALEAVERGASVLKNGGTALDAVEEAIKAMEIGGVFNAGRGSVRRANGEIEMDASIMDGSDLSIGAVACLQGIDNPISVAKALLTELPVLLAGQGATEFAKSRGFPKQLLINPNSVQNSSCDTVGCVAKDIKGNIAVGLSTGGLSGVMPGRVGDAPLPGCGFYVDNNRGGVCFSGEGETIARTMLASEVIHKLSQASGDEAAEHAMACLKRVNGEAGCILIDKNGQPAWTHNSTHFAVALQTGNDEKPSVYLKKSEV
jgi:beta-aspartyl-peptidase (threonine type)